MNTRAKKQLTVLIMVAMLLVLLIVAAIFLMPGGKVIKTVKTPAKENVNSSATEEEVNKFDFVGRIFDKNMKPMGNAEFVISIGPTEFTTDENGYFRLNGLPVGIYKLYAIVDGEQVGETEIQLSNDGCFSVGYVFFEDGAVVTMIFDGTKFIGIEIRSDSGEVEDEDAPEDSTATENDGTDEEDSNEDGNVPDTEEEGADDSEDKNNSEEDESDSEETESDDASKDTESDNKDTESDDTESEPDDSVEEEDPTYTNLSWMKDVPYGFGAYGLNTTYNPELFIEVVTNPEYDYINTFLIDSGERFEQALFEAKYLAENGKYFYLNVHGLLAVGDADVNKNLKGNWRSQLNKWASELYTIGGDYFQGFYFDEVDLYLNEKDFTRVTKYMREHFGLRTFAVHRRDPFTIPASVGMSIDRYKGTKFVIDSENHKYVTDVGWWWYGGYEYYGYNAERLGDLWQEAMDLLDPNTRKWIVPPTGSFDFRHDEEDCLEVAYAMYREASKVEGFGGLMFYTMQDGGLWGGYGEIEVDDPRLTDDDYLKDENGNFVYVEKTDKDGNIVYEEDEEGNEILDEQGNKIPVMTRVLNIQENHSMTAHRDGQINYSVEGSGNYWIMTPNQDGSYNWPRMRQYFEILGKGITSGESRDSILSKLNEVFTPDYSKYE